MSSAIPALKAALRDVARDLWPDAQTYRAVPPIDKPRDLAVIGDARATITRPTTGGASRSREESAEVELIVSCYRPVGLDRLDDDGVQLVASMAAWAMLDQLHNWLRIRGNETLGGVCRDAWVSETEDHDYPLLTDDGLLAGRCTDITITITAATRI